MNRAMWVRAVLMLVVAAVLVWRVSLNGRDSVPHGVEQGPAGLSSASGGEELAAAQGPVPGEEPLTSVAGRLIDQDGHVRSLAQFRGEPFVASAIYTRCPSVCPRTVAQLQRLARSLPMGDAPHIVLFSLDPTHDTPRALRSFAGAHGLVGARWTLLQPDTGALPAIAHALGLAWSSDPGGGIAHTAVIAIVDSSGRVRDRRTALDADPAALLAAWRSIGMAQRQVPD